MSHTAPQPTKKERREAAREARLAKEREEEAAAARRRRVVRLGAVLVAGLAVVAVAIALSSGGGDDGAAGGGEVSGAKESAAMLAGIPQKGITLGRPDAPVTLVEFADPQCPFCKEYALNAMPQLIERYVRTGKVRMQLQVMTFVGPDSVPAGRTIAAAAAQDKLWNVSDLMYWNQGQENTGYVTDQWLTDIVNAVPGLDGQKALAEKDGPAARKVLAEADAEAKRYAIDSTPSFLVGRTGGKLEKISVQSLSASELGAAIDARLPQGQS